MNFIRLFILLKHLHLGNYMILTRSWNTLINFVSKVKKEVPLRQILHQDWPRYWTDSRVDAQLIIQEYFNLDQFNLNINRYFPPNHYFLQTSLPFILDISAKINTLKITPYSEGHECYVFSKISIEVVINESHMKLVQIIHP